MKEFFKDKKVVITGHVGVKSLWLQELLRSFDVDVISGAEIGDKQSIKNFLSIHSPKIIFHVTSLPNVEDSVSYISTSHILDATRDMATLESLIIIPSDKESDKEWHPSLNEEEKKELARLLERAENVQIRGEVWHQLVKKFITVPIELCILDDEDRVFLVYRKDREFDGYHMPGTVVNDWETVEEASLRLVAGEVVRDAGLTITVPKPVGWIEVRRGDGPEENKTRNTIALLHIAKLTKDFIRQEGSGFYHFDNIPPNTLGSHKFLLRRFAQYLQDGKIVLGK